MRPNLTDALVAGIVAAILLGGLVIALPGRHAAPARVWYCSQGDSALIDTALVRDYRATAQALPGHGPRMVVPCRPDQR